MNNDSIETLQDFIKSLEERLNTVEAENERLREDNKALSYNVVSLGDIIKKKERLWGYLESRFVEVCKTCTPEERAKCLMFPDMCEGECKEIVDLEALIDKAADRGEIR